MCQDQSIVHAGLLLLLPSFPPPPPSTCTAVFLSSLTATLLSFPVSFLLSRILFLYRGHCFPNGRFSAITRAAHAEPRSPTGREFISRL